MGAVPVSTAGWCPDPRPRLPRCLHCDRGREDLDADRCCPGCQDRGHAGPWRECPVCAQERLLLADRAAESLRLARWELSPEPVY